MNKAGLISAARAVVARCLIAVASASLAVGAYGADEMVPDMFFRWTEGVPSWFSGEIGAEFSSAYLATSGTICDNRPVASQEFDWLIDLGDYGWIDGYGWLISSLHDKQHAAHREPFNEFEGTAHYGYDWKLHDNMTLSAFAGLLWNPQIGYRRDSDRYWGSNFGMSLKNPYVTPYCNALAMHQPTPRARARIGIRRSFSVCKQLSITPSAETVWADIRRYRTRYGEDPEHRFMHGAFITMLAGVKAEWRFAETLSVSCRLRQFDTIDRQARRLVKDKPQYYAKRDLAIVGVGLTWRF